MVESEFFEHDPRRVARGLLSTVLFRRIGETLLSGRIVEVEAYLVGDAASHAFKGRTPRNASMFGPPGRAYVYTMHGHNCLNVVTEGEGIPSAILIRAIEPLTGIESMMSRRMTPDFRKLTAGPGRLCQAMDIDRRFDGWDLTLGNELWIERLEPVAESLRAEPTDRILTTTRVGVRAAHDRKLRYVVENSPFLSR